MFFNFKIKYRMVIVFRFTNNNMFGKGSFFYFLFNTIWNCFGCTLNLINSYEKSFILRSEIKNKILDDF